MAHQTQKKLNTHTMLIQMKDFQVQPFFWDANEMGRSKGKKLKKNITGGQRRKRNTEY